MVTGSPASSVAVPHLAETPLGRTIATTSTDIWNDSCSIPELEYAIGIGAVGATADPTIVNDVWKHEPGHWRDRALAAADGTATEVDLAGAVVEIPNPDARGT
jgi:transaldolase